jgi:hypothetical protein
VLNFDVLVRTQQSDSRQLVINVQLKGFHELLRSHFMVFIVIGFVLAQFDLLLLFELFLMLGGQVDSEVGKDGLDQVQVHADLTELFSHRQLLDHLNDLLAMSADLVLYLFQLCSPLVNQVRHGEVLHLEVFKLDPIFLYRRHFAIKFSHYVISVQQIFGVWSIVFLQFFVQLSHKKVEWDFIHGVTTVICSEMVEDSVYFFVIVFVDGFHEHSERNLELLLVSQPL